jgi:CheY-like chemotaxis protein
VSVEARGALVLGDANRLQQVIWNILSNAVKFTSENGAIDARLTCSGRQVEISISDTGIGIEPQFQPYIFDRFRQADSTSTRKYGGLGLGLAIVRHLTELHGGSVAVSSPGAGQGSTFKAIFPVASVTADRQLPSSTSQPAAEQSARSARAHNSHKLEGLRVLVVEDDRDTLDMLRFILDKSGAQVITAASTQEALQALDRSHPDALVSDLAMPEQDGYELIKQVRSRNSGFGGKIPAVALSAYTRAEDRERALDAGFQVHAAKPVDPETLITLLADLTADSHT